VKMCCITLESKKENNNPHFFLRKILAWGFGYTWVYNIWEEDLFVHEGMKGASYGIELTFFQHKLTNLATNSGKKPRKGGKNPHTQQNRSPHHEIFQTIIEDLIILAKVCCYHDHGSKRLILHLQLDTLLKSKKWQTISNDCMLTFLKHFTSTSINLLANRPISSHDFFQMCDL
jgi:hypothetical protein